MNPTTGFRIRGGAETACLAAGAHVVRGVVPQLAPVVPPAVVVLYRHVARLVAREDAARRARRRRLAAAVVVAVGASAAGAQALCRARTR